MVSIGQIVQETNLQIMLAIQVNHRNEGNDKIKQLICEQISIFFNNCLFSAIMMSVIIVRQETEIIVVMIVMIVVTKLIKRV